MRKYIIKPEMLGGEECFMIYRWMLGFRIFLERWNTRESAEVRKKELEARHLHVDAKPVTLRPGGVSAP